MEIGATESERGHASTAWVRRWTGPFERCGRYKERNVGPINRRIRRLEIGTWRDGSVVQSHDRFHDASNARRCFQVTNLRFDGPDRYVSSSFNTGPKSRKRGEFRGVANLGGRSVSLHEFNGRCRVSSLTVSPCNGLNLTPLTGCRDAFATAVRRTSNAPDDTENFVVVSNGIAQSLQHQNACAFTHHESVGSCIKGRGVRWRERPDGGKFRKGGRVHGSVGSACKHDVDLSCLQQAARIQNGGH